jgi:hypothetical protein
LAPNPLSSAGGGAHGPREYACHEGNYSLANILAGARQMDRR